MRATITAAITSFALFAALSPAPAEGYRFVVLADSRSDCEGQAVVNTEALGRVFGKIAEIDPAFVFFGGDLVCGRRDQASVESELRVWRQTIESSGYSANKVYPVFGGHERVGPIGPGTGGNLQMTFAAFHDFFDPVSQPVLDCVYYDPKHNPPGERTDFSHTVYYCDFEDDRFFVLNNDCIPRSHSLTRERADGHGCVVHEIGCAQFNWVRANLAGNGRRHNFFFQHEPAFGTGAHNTGRGRRPGCGQPLAFVMDTKKPQRNDWVRLLGHHNATAVFSGHEHQYTRRFIDHGLLDTGTNTDRVKTSLAVVITADSDTDASGFAAAHAFDGARKKAPLLKLWWTKKGGKPDWKGRVRARSDDAMELGTGEVRVGGKKLELQTAIALRWTDVPIPPGERIKKARIELTAKRNFDGTQTVRIKGEAAPFAFPFTQCAADLTQRPQTRSSSAWTIGRWKKNKKYLTKNLAKVFQEMVETHHSGLRFPIGFQEVKTGSAGAPWSDHLCSAFMGGILGQVITRGDADRLGAAWGEDSSVRPYHFAVIDVDGSRFNADVYALRANGEFVRVDSTR